MDNNNPSQNNLSNNVNESSFTGFYNLQPTPTTFQNISNDVNTFCDHNANNFFTANDTNFPVHTSVTSNNSVTISDLYDHNYQQQFMSDNAYPQYIGQNPPQSTFPPANSLNITINSPQTNFSEIFRFGFNIIIMPISSPIITNSDTQSQPRQDHINFSYSSSDIISDNSQTQFQQ